MKGILKLGIILALYATAACVGLAFVYAGTKTVIAERQASDLKAALSELFPKADGFDKLDASALKTGIPNIVFEEAYAAKSGGAVSGVALRAAGPSYGGKTVVLVGIGADKKITGAKILENKDTPGLGANAASPSYFVDRKSKTTFMGQFAGKSADDPFKVRGDVDVIAASTITSVAVANVVKASGQAGGSWLAAQAGK